MPLNVLVVALLLILLVGVVLVLLFMKKRKMKKSFPPSHKPPVESNSYGPIETMELEVQDRTTLIHVPAQVSEGLGPINGVFTRLQV